ncbi:MAG: hypothetical protein AAF632_17380 [Bacteroidota bacterium]
MKVQVKHDDNVIQGLEQFRKPSWVVLGILYTVCWLSISLYAPVAIRLVLMVLLLAFSLRSYFHCVAIFLMVLFIPAFSEMIADVSRGLDVSRILFIPFLIYSLTQKKVRNIKGGQPLLVLIALSLVMGQLASGFQILFRGMPTSVAEEPSNNLLTVLSRVYDNLAIVAFLYFSFTRLTIPHLKWLFMVLILYGLFFSASILEFNLRHYELLSNPSSDTVIWQNPFFDHKNYWSMILVFILLFALILHANTDSHKILLRLCIAVSLMAIATSLSRQAYVWSVLAFLLVAAYNRNYKVIMYGFLVAIAIALLQPEFLFKRMESMLAADSKEDFQALNSKVSDAALDQFVNNFTVVPQMFYEDWEYNWSEGFWNGYLHQVGILGLAFLLYLYFLVYRQFYSLYQVKDKILKNIGLMGMVSVFLMTTASVNRRLTNFMNYAGEITEVGLLMMFLILYASVLYYDYCRQTTKQKQQR